MKPTSSWLLLLCLVPAVSAAEIYRSVDEDGNVVYTDQPIPGGKPVDLPELSTYESPPAPAISPQPSAATEPAAQGQSTLNFVQPSADETIFDNQGNVMVAVRVEPPLTRDQQLALQLDGGETVQSAEPTYQFTGVDRGTHTLRAWVVSSNGQQLGEPASVIFHLRQASRMFRNPAPQSGPVQQAPRAPTAPNVPAPGGS